jgi:hypothetical protein
LNGNKARSFVLDVCSLEVSYYFVLTYVRGFGEK